MRQQSVDDVWARIEAAARETGGEGVVATDADGTLWQGDVGEDLFRAFLEHGRVEPVALEALQTIARRHELSDAGKGPDVARRIYASYAEGHFPEESMCELMAWCFGGWTRDEVQAFANEVVLRSDLSARLHEEVQALLGRVRAAGIDTFVVSASPHAAVVAAGALVGFSGHAIVAACPLFSAERMDPDVDRPIPYGLGKVTRLRERIGSAVVLAALGDNAFDVDLLASARVSVAVRPKPRLRQRAALLPELIELTLT